ncbi:MAG: hypothetical protein HC808_16100 [Candidatus Competibacteraceae bacterium]|nr:hypothetical protein [Candidatus Competibacteraceae bacterium]
MQRKYGISVLLFHRNPASYGIGVILMMIVMGLMSYLFSIIHSDSFEVVGSQRTTGTILSIKEHILRGKFSETTVYSAQVRLPEGKQAGIRLEPPYPKIGDTVPIKITFFKDGSTIRSLDLQQHQPWR